MGGVALSFLLLLFSLPPKRWFLSRFLPFVISMGTLVGFSLLLGGKGERILDISLRCCGIFLLLSAAMLRVPPERMLSRMAGEGKPSPFLLLLYLIFRYLNLVLEEGRRMARALQARGGSLRSFSLREMKIFSNLIIRSVERSEMVALAIEARGWERAVPASPLGEEIKVKGVSFAYPDGTRALEDISFVIRKGEKVALLGANGAGKSTLLWVLGGFLPFEGEIEIFGVPLTRENIPKIRKLVGIVFEDPDDQLIMPSLLEDVVFGLLNLGHNRQEAEEMAREMLIKMGLEGYEAHHPHNLSQGQKKRASLAGVLVMRAEVLLLDEPTANLDAQGRRELLQILGELDKTMLIATHDLDSVQEICPRALVLEKGRLVWDGETSRLLENPSLLREWKII